MTFLHTLPTKILYRILNNLNDFDLCVTMPNICTSLNKDLSRYYRYKVSSRMTHFFVIKHIHTEINNITIM